jgi:redox-sensitive bicupin YhaK (pirin superfamily)
MGNGSVIRPGDVQRMSAGTGVMHSERNPSNANPVRFLQIWIIPDQKGLKPTYDQKHFTDQQKQGRLLQVASPDGKDGSISIHQDAHVYTTLLDPGQSVAFENKKERNAWVQVAKGKAILNGQKLEMGDGAAVTGKESLKIEGKESAEILLFDLP